MFVNKWTVKNDCVLFIDEDCACRTIRVMINGQEAELTIIDIPYIEMSVSFYWPVYAIRQNKTKSYNIMFQDHKKCFYLRNILVAFWNCFRLKSIIVPRERGQMFYKNVYKTKNKNNHEIYHSLIKRYKSK